MTNHVLLISIIFTYFDIFMIAKRSTIKYAHKTHNQIDILRDW